jgi:hypothetical protein
VSAPYAGADIAHFSNIRGTNEFEDHEAVIVLGREQPSPRDAERRAKAIWYDTKKPIREIKPAEKAQVQYPYRERHYPMRDESRPKVRVRVHPDARPAKPQRRDRPIRAASPLLTAGAGAFRLGLRKVRLGLFDCSRNMA